MACWVGPGGIHHGRRAMIGAARAGSGLQALVCDHGDALAGKLLFRLGEGFLMLGRRHAGQQPAGSRQAKPQDTRAKNGGHFPANRAQCRATFGLSATSPSCSTARLATERQHHVGAHASSGAFPDRR